MITLDPTVVGKFDRGTKEVIAKERKEEWEAAHPKEQAQLRNKARGKNSSLRRFLRKKQKNVVDQRKVGKIGPCHGIVTAYTHLIFFVFAARCGSQVGKGKTHSRQASKRRG
jgi:hypothetical protein